MAAPDTQTTIPDVETTLLQPSRAVMKQVEEAVRRFDLIAPGDRVAVGLSGGKDSLLLACALRELTRRSDALGDFEIVGLHLDQQQPGFDRALFEEVVALCGIGLVVVTEDTHSIVQSQLKPGQIPCSICGRLRRGILNRFCAENGFTKLAMGHHLDDAAETFLLNLFFGRRLDPLKAATPSENGPTTIRPLILVEERKISAWVEESGITPVACPVCDTYPESQRRNIKEMLSSFEAYHPDFRASVRKALYDA